MDTFWIGISIVSSLVALVMTVVAWRTSRAERAASAARVAALSAAAAVDVDRTGEKLPQSSSLEQFESEPLAVGAARPAPWTAARVSPFTVGSRAAQSVTRTEPHELALRATPESLSVGAALSENFLGATMSPAASSDHQRWLGAAAILLFGVVLVGGYWAVFGDGSPGTTVTAATTTSPLELVSMRHERRGTRLAVTGLVRNPVAGVPVDRLAAVVFLFDQQGAFITSARANIDFLKLAPGDESPFVIDVEAPSQVARYRVSFRNDVGVVPHVDRRGQQPIALTSIR